MSTHRHHSGIALLYILMATAVLGAALAYASIELQRSVQRYSLLLDRAAAREMSFAPLLLTQSLLLRDLRTNQHDGANDRWWRLQQWQEFPIENGIIRLRLTPLDAYLSVNHLFTDTTRDPLFRQAFQRMIQSSKVPARTTDVLIDWIDPNTIPRRQGKESAFYAARQPFGYPTRNDEEQTYSFLRLIDGWTPELESHLRQHMGLIAVDTDYNINTLHQNALEALFPKAKSLFKAAEIRRTETYTDLATFLQDAGIEEEHDSIVKFGTRTNQFVLQAEVTYHGVTMRYSAYFNRQNNNADIEALIQQ